MMEILVYLTVATAISLIGYRWKWSFVPLIIALTTTIIVVSESATFTGLWLYVGLSFVLIHMWIAFQSSRGA